MVYTPGQVRISSSGFFIKYRIYPGKKLRDSEESAVSHILGVESYEQIYTVDYAGKSLNQIMILSVRYVAQFSCFDRFQGVQIDPLWLDETDFSITIITTIT